MENRVALIMLYDRQKRLLLQHRTEDARIMPGYWAFFGGGIKDGETPEEAVRREAFEELHYRAKAPEFVYEQDYEIGDIRGHMYVFIEEFSGDKSALKLQEGQGWGWFKYTEIAPLKMIEHDREVVRFVGRLIEKMNTT
ncbi:MAG: NUDIX domain-containing protein [Thermodesulfovibrionales bacterium]|nr:NUDIX domain-containing protein [Thermodesulfovibrionales bacterium]